MQVTLNPDLHMICTNSEVPGGIEQTRRSGVNTPINNNGDNNTNQDNAGESDTKQDNESVPGCLPDYFPTAEQSLINWRKRNDGNSIVLSS